MLAQTRTNHFGYQKTSGLTINHQAVKAVASLAETEPVTETSVSQRVYQINQKSTELIKPKVENSLSA